jgi:hypothetical protein
LIIDRESVAARLSAVADVRNTFGKLFQRSKHVCKLELAFHKEGALRTWLENDIVTKTNCDTPTKPKRGKRVATKRKVKWIRGDGPHFSAKNAAESPPPTVS